MKEAYPLELHDLLTRFAAQEKPASYLEIGVFNGASLEALLAGHRPSRVVLIDDWSYFGGADNLSTVRSLVGDAPVEFRCGNSHSILKQLRGPFQFITVDGDHTAGGAREDLEDAWRLLQPGGYLFFDDIFHPGLPHLESVFDTFVAAHPDARLITKEFYHTLAPGCGVVRKLDAVPLQA